MFVSSGVSGSDNTANLILVNDPAFVFVIPAVMTATVFDDLVNGQVLQGGVGSQNMTVARLAHSRGTGNYDVGFCPGHCVDTNEYGMQKEDLL